MVTDGNRVHQAASASGIADAVKLTVVQDLIAPVAVTFGSGNTAAGTT